MKTTTGDMSQNKCIVLLLLEACSKDELCSPNGSLHDVFLKTITRCKCPEHIAENPIELPTIDALLSDVTVVLNELLEWGIDHMHEDTSGNSRALVKFIQKSCLDDSPTSLLTIMDNLQKQYGKPQ